VDECKPLVHGGDGLRSLRTPSMAAKLNAALDADPQFWQGARPTRSLALSFTTELYFQSWSSLNTEY